MDIVLPNINNKEEVVIKDTGISEFINRETISNDTIGSTDNFEYPYYMIDLTNVDTVNSMFFKSISSIGNVDGDINLYVRSKSDTIYLLKFLKEDIGLLRTFLKEKCILYKNYGQGEEKIENRDMQGSRIYL